MAFKTRKGSNDELNAGFSLEIDELRLNRVSCFGRNYVCLINNTTGQTWKVDSRNCNNGRYKRNTANSQTQAAPGDERRCPTYDHSNAFVSRRRVRISLEVASAHYRLLQTPPSACWNGRRSPPKLGQGKSLARCCRPAPLRCSHVAQR